jgi:pyruvate dehydrogenase E1 component alpha subunit
MKTDLWELYRQMLRSRLFEEAVQKLWLEGRISGEMHMGLGEEGIVAGINAHLREGDALALDHRGTPPLVMRGVDLRLLARELLGRPDGLCAGQGGHMHLFSPEHLAASSGIVGAAAPTAAGLALAGRQLRPGSLAVAFFGEGAMNQGMVMEALNLAAVWKLPVLFVCKDNARAITTHSPAVTAGSLLDRARSFALFSREVAGSDVEAVSRVAGKMAERLRKGKGPAFLLASCVHLEGHFLGDPLLRLAREPVAEMKERAGPLLRAAVAGKGSAFGRRLKGLASVSASIARSRKEGRTKRRDPLIRARRELERDGERLEALEVEVGAEIARAIEESVGETSRSGRPVS